MTRSGYTEDCENDWSMIRWRGAVASAIRGRRGQAFLREMLATLDAMPEKRLIAGDLVFEGLPNWDGENEIIVGADELITDRGAVVRVGEVCAMGAVGRARKLDMSKVDSHEAESVADLFGISGALAKEIAYVNDEDWQYGKKDTSENRFERVHAWVAKHLATDPPA
jgi:hypothetical protein